MKVLIVKTSSLGDVIHTLPAITDAAQAMPGISFDWLVEKTFQDVPLLHPSIKQVIPVSIRKWRKNPWKYRVEIRNSFKQIRSKQYDLVIDAQGLIKSAVLTRLAKGERYGLSRSSCREPLASLAYQHKIDIPKGQHAIARVRQLFAESLGYELLSESLSYGLDKKNFPLPEQLKQPYLMFLHGTTWASKHWPNEYWKELISLAAKQGFNVYLPWGNELEKYRASELSKAEDKAYVLPKSSIKELAHMLMHADGAVGVDSGLAHLAAACGTAAITLYGSTSAELTGTMGDNNQTLQADFRCSPCLSKECTYTGESSIKPACYQQLSPELIWQSLNTLMVE
ncbi:MAG: lipopolysaccharide heptosyltransferase I [Cycloclasticus sp.]|nr:MAG: lipopolysaccharide heptosyltransferase I [Cycloclasticus sp.]